ncbi:hypothetical protein B0H13DRAFT_2344050 [Mycena leptocephala]|nr:hypothetical protein B0H13DRAFT_2344050 [Mycena leptocephala]
MASATPEPTIFDLAAASAFVLRPSFTPPPPAPPPTSTPDPPPTTNGATSKSRATSARSVNSSASLPSTGFPSSQGIAPSHGLTVPSSPPITVSLSTHGNSFPAGAIAGIIIIGIFLMITLAVLLLCVRRRRRQGVYVASPLPITSPYADDSFYHCLSRRSPRPSNASAWNDSDAPLVRIGRQHLQTESRAAQKSKILHNKEWDSSPSFDPASQPLSLFLRSERDLAILQDNSR